MIVPGTKHTAWTLPPKGVLLLGNCLSQAAFQCVLLIFHIADDGGTNDVAVPVYDVSGGVASQLSNKIFIQLVFRIWGKVEVCHAFFREDVLRCLRLLFALTVV